MKKAQNRKKAQEKKLRYRKKSETEYDLNMMIEKYDDRKLKSTVMMRKRRKKSIDD